MPELQSPPNAETIVDGRSYLYFIGTGYLGLQGREELIEAGCAAMRKYGIAGGTTRAGYGTTPPAREAEQAAARFFGTEAALYFASGYLGASMVTTALADRFDALFLDEASHYCLWEAARLSGKPVHPFAHCDPAALAEQLETHVPRDARPLLVSDGLFAARGTIAPLAEYQNILGRYQGASILLDDCHGFGVLGERGRGSYELAGIDPAEVNRSPEELQKSSAALYVTGTASKALGSFGGLIPGSRKFIDLLKNAAPHHAGTSSPPVATAAATAEAFRVLHDEPQLRQRLARNVALLRGELRALGFSVPESTSPIICLELESAARMKQIQSTLQAQGILIAYMPTYAGLGPAGALRIAVFATHTVVMLHRLVMVLREVGNAECGMRNAD